jgi:hypothetical protein
MSYKEEIWKKLSEYKKENLSSLKDGYYRGKAYGHILPWICGESNLLKAYQEKFLRNKLAENIKFHQYFHHLNSSQAMCINFFFPLVVEKELSVILKELGLDEKVDYGSIEFEKESLVDKRDGQRPTNFDFYFKTESGKEFYFEIKYTEPAFGDADPDTAHINKYEQIYKAAASKTIEPTYNKRPIFLANYQIMRNLIHLSKDSYVIFIYPEHNKKVRQQATEAEKFVLPEYQENFKQLTWETLLRWVGEQKFEGKLGDQYCEFKKKYPLQ